MKKGRWVLSHFLVVTLAFLAGRSVSDGDNATSRQLAATKSERQRTEREPDADGLLAEVIFSEENEQKALAAAVAKLPPVSDHRAAFDEALAAIPSYYRSLFRSPPNWDMIEGDPGYESLSLEEKKSLAILGSRIRGWMQAEPEICLQHLAAHLPMTTSYGFFVFLEPVLAHLDGLSLSRARELLLLVNWDGLDRTLRNRRVANGSSLRDLIASESELRTAALRQSSELSFSDRDLLFDSIFFPDSDERINSNSYYRRSGLEDFLSNPNHPPRETLAWALEKQATEGLSKEMKNEMTNAFATWVESATDLPPDERVAALETFGRKKKDPYRWLAEGDVYKILEKEGRDWAYEFRHGRVSAEQVWSEVSSKLQDYPEEGEKGARFGLYKVLAEEDHEKAFAVIQSLPELRQREVMFHSTWTAFTFEDPQKLLDFSQSLPPAEAQWERGAQLKGWDWKARHYLARHGDDYVDWVKAMPSGIEKEEALESLVWATKEADRERGIALEKELYPDR